MITLTIEVVSIDRVPINKYAFLWFLHLCVCLAYDVTVYDDLWAIHNTVTLLLLYQIGARNIYKYRMTKANQYKACPTRIDHCRDLFRGKLSINQVILQNIHYYYY